MTSQLVECTVKNNETNENQCQFVKCNGTVIIPNINLGRGSKLLDFLQKGKINDFGRRLLTLVREKHMIIKPTGRGGNKCNIREFLCDLKKKYYNSLVSSQTINLNTFTKKFSNIDAIKKMSDNMKLKLLIFLVYAFIESNYSPYDNSRDFTPKVVKDTFCKHRLILSANYNSLFENDSPKNDSPKNDSPKNDSPKKTPNIFGGVCIKYWLVIGFFKSLLPDKKRATEIYNKIYEIVKNERDKTSVDNGKFIESILNLDSLPTIDDILNYDISKGGNKNKSRRHNKYKKLNKTRRQNKFSRSKKLNKSRKQRKSKKLNITRRHKH